MSPVIDLEAMKNVSTADLARRAHEEVYAICSGKRRWTMTIPVQDDDSDVLIGFALEALEKDLAAERTRREAAEKLLRRVQGEGLRSDIMRGIDLLLAGRTLEGGEGIE